MFPEGVNVVDKTLPGKMVGVGLHIFAGQGSSRRKEGISTVVEYTTDENA